MILNLKQVFDIVGEQIDIDYQIADSDLKSIKGYEFAKPADIKGTVRNRAGIVLLKYNTKFTLRLICDRCLKEFERDFSFDFEHIVVKSLNGSRNEDEYILAEQSRVNLDELATSDMLLQLPTKQLCYEDCKGLCNICGCDLNVSDCDCAAD